MTQNAQIADPSALPEAATTGAAAAEVTTIIGQATEAAPWLLHPVLGLPAWQWIGFAATFVLLWVLGRLVRWALRRAVVRAGPALGQATADELIAAGSPPLGVFTFALATRGAFAWLHLPEETARFVHLGWRIAAISAIAWAAFRSAMLIARLGAGVAARRGTKLDEHLTPLIARVTRVAIVGLGLVLVVEELGYNVAGLVAGLGIGGLAVALAAQDTLGNWFGAATMYTDRPFEIGDWIKSDQIEGTVEDIGLRSTRIRTFESTELTVPNRILATAVIENHSRMRARRARYVLTLRTSTSLDQLRTALGALRAAIAEHPGVMPGEVVVRFSELGASSLEVLVQFFTRDTSLDGHLAVREDISATTLRIFGELGVQLAYPTQSLHIETVAAPAPSDQRTESR